MQAFEADVALLPQWVQIWVNFLSAVAVLSAIALLIRKDTRRLGVYSVLAMVLIAPSMIWMHGQMGMVRLLGIVHLVFWGPLVWVLWQRMRTNPPGGFYSAILWIAILTLGVSLAFDFADVVRWVLGEREVMAG